MSVIDGGPVVSPAKIDIIDGGRVSSAFGDQRLGMIDLLGQQPFFIEHDVTLPTAMWRDEITAQLYMLVGKRDIMLWEDPAQPLSNATWRSKVAVHPFATNYSAIYVQSDFADATGFAFKCTVIADGVEVATVTEVNKPVRLPTGFLAKEWEIEFWGDMPVTAVAIGHSVEEIMRGLNV